MKVYGFGSYFSVSMPYRDVDILIVHESNSYQSCMQAIEFKKIISKEIDKSDVSILSKSEEQYFNFIVTSRAVFLGGVDEDGRLSCLEKIVSTVKTFRKPNEQG